MNINEASVITEKQTARRIRYKFGGVKPGPLVVLFGGIHGNEKAGLAAADRVAARLKEEEEEVRGTVYVMNGNLPALEAGMRYIDTDLNRVWEVHYNPLHRNHKEWFEKTSEYSQSLAIKETIHTLIDEHGANAEDIVFADMHTTSAQSCGFVLLNDTLANRKLAGRFPAPQILGIEENIKGTLLSYINNLGYKAIGFEAGAHYEGVSVDRTEAFILLLLHHTKAIELQREEVKQKEEILHPKAGISQTYYDVKYHKIIDNPESFRMLSGFQNFDTVERGLPLAYENGELVKAPVSGRIFMPLYQNKGHDGFLIVKEVSAFWLELSAWLRQNFFHSLLKYFPGVSPYGSRGYQVNLKIAMFYVDDIFHLLGYRITRKDEETLICYRR